MAYATTLDVTCQKDRCKSRSTYLVKNRRNEQIGKFCERHARLMVNQISAAEEAEDLARG